MKLLRIYLKTFAYAGAFVPLVYCVGFTSPYIFAQTSLIYLIACATVVPVFVLWYADANARPHVDRWTIIPLIYLCTMILSACFGVNPAKSFIGVWERFGGVLDWTVVFWYGILLISIFKTKAEWYAFLRTVSIVAAAETMYALLQLSPWHIVYASGTRLFGTIGNPAFLAGYLLLAMGITFVMRLQAGTRIRFVYDLCIIAQCLVLMLTQTRAALIGPLVGLAGYAVIASKGQRNALRSALRTFGIFFIIIGIAIGSIISLKKIDITHVTQSVLHGDTSQTRAAIWEAALQGFSDRPLLGAGENNFIIVFQRHFDPRIYLGQEDSAWSDHAHNEFLDRLALGGALGLIAYLLMLLVLPFKLVRRSDVNDADGVARASMVPWILAYATYLFFFFHSIADSMLWVIAIAFLISTRSSMVPAAASAEKKVAPTSMALASFVSVMLVTWYVLVPMRTNILVRQGMQAQSIEQAMPLYMRAWNGDVRGRPHMLMDLFDRVQFRDEDPRYAALHILQLQHFAEAVAEQYPFELQYQSPLIFAYRHRTDDPAYLWHAIGLAGLGIELSPDHPEPYMTRGVTELDAAAAAQDAKLKASYFDQAKTDFSAAHRLAPQSADTSILFLGTDDVSNTEPHVQLKKYIHDNAQRIKFNDWVLAIQLGIYYRDRDLMTFLGNELDVFDSYDVARFKVLRDYLEREKAML